MKQFSLSIVQWVRVTALVSVTLLPVGVSGMMREQVISQMLAFTPFETNLVIPEVEAGFDLPAATEPPEDNVPPVPSKPGGTF